MKKQTYVDRLSERLNKLDVALKKQHPKQAARLLDQIAKIFHEAAYEAQRLAIKLREELK